MCSKTYPNGFTALKNINLQIEQGEFVAIIGLSGAGKSSDPALHQPYA